MPGLSAREYRRRAVEALILYATGGAGYEAAMDELAQDCSAGQWRALTVWQREGVAARREGRPSRFPSIFSTLLDDPEALATARALQAELGGELPDYIERAS